MTFARTTLLNREIKGRIRNSGFFIYPSSANILFSSFRQFLPGTLSIVSYYKSEFFCNKITNIYLNLCLIQTFKRSKIKFSFKMTLFPRSYKRRTPFSNETLWSNEKYSPLRSNEERAQENKKFLQKNHS